MLSESDLSRGARSRSPSFTSCWSACWPSCVCECSRPDLALRRVRKALARPGGAPGGNGAETWPCPSPMNLGAPAGRT